MNQPLTARTLAAPGPTFAQPFEMLAACHERVQRMLALLVPGELWVRLVAVLGGALVGLMYAASFVHLTTEHRAVKAGFAPGRAQAERDRLAAEAAQAREQLTALRAETEDVRRHRDDALAALRRLTEQVEAALALASPGPSERFLLVGNSVVDEPVQSAPRMPVPS